MIYIDVLQCAAVCVAVCVAVYLCVCMCVGFGGCNGSVMVTRILRRAHMILIHMYVLQCVSQCVVEYGNSICFYGFTDTHIFTHTHTHTYTRTKT